MTIYFTSDLHLSHENIIRLCNRPFKDAQNMDKELIKNWNSVVKNHSDIVYVLGDFSMRGSRYEDWFVQTLKKMRGRKILILGNHDKCKPFEYVEYGFESVHTSLIINEKVLLCHDPAWSVAAPRDWLTLCGHVHDAFKYLSQGRSIVNVGVDVWDYKPITMSDIYEYMILFNPDKINSGHRCDFIEELKQ